MSQSTTRIVCEQAVYGSFPFWDKGYGILAKSGGCRQEWFSDLIHLCQSLGQPPSDATPTVASLVFAHRLPSGPWLVGLGSSQGCDDRGRPGAWAFHALFISGDDYRRCGGSPFVFEAYFKKTFEADCQLDTLVAELVSPDVDLPEADSQKRKWLRQGRRLRLLTQQSADREISQFWHNLPVNQRSRHSITTWAFRTDTDFDFAAFSPNRWPHQQAFKTSTEWAFEVSELWNQPHDRPKLSDYFRSIVALSKRYYYALAGLVALVFMCLVLRSCVTNQPAQSAASQATVTKLDSRNKQPDYRDFVVKQWPSSVVSAIGETLTDWAERLEIPVENPAQATPWQLAEGLATGLRYGGPVLTPNLAESSVSRQAYVKIIAYVKQVDILLRVRPLPQVPQQAQTDAVFALVCLAWSTGADQLQAEVLELQNQSDVRDWFIRFREWLIPEAIAADLTPTGVEQQHPELVDYRLHLSRLERLMDK